MIPHTLLSTANLSVGSGMSLGQVSDHLPAECHCDLLLFCFQPAKKNWRSQHEEFIASIRYAKMVTAVEAGGGNIADLPPPPKSENVDYIQCPHCKRKYNQAAGERHIPKCKDIKAKPTMLKKGGRR